MHELSYEFLKEQYIDLGKTRYQISAETGVSPMRIGSLLQQYGIRRYRIERHGLCAHPLNVIWCGMKERCQNPNADNYKWYGGIGITICDEWKSFINFYNWAISHGWEDGLTIDRIDVTNGYSPENCRFVTIQQQFRNRRSNCPITVDGETHLACEWSEMLNIPARRIYKWKHRNGMDYTINKLRELKNICGSKE